MDLIQEQVVEYGAYKVMGDKGCLVEEFLVVLHALVLQNGQHSSP